MQRHVPLIRFKYGAARSTSNEQINRSVSEKIVEQEKPVKSFIARHKKDPKSKPIERASPLEFIETPKKYRRRALTQEEIDSINVKSFFFSFRSSKKNFSRFQIGAFS